MLFFLTIQILVSIKFLSDIINFFKSFSTQQYYFWINIIITDIIINIILMQLMILKIRVLTTFVDLKSG